MDEGAAYKFFVRYEHHIYEMSFGSPRVFDPQEPPEYWGRPLEVCLLPHYPLLSIIRISVPAGAELICHKFRFQGHTISGSLDTGKVTIETPAPPVTLYRCGYKLNGVISGVQVRMPDGKREPLTVVEELR